MLKDENDLTSDFQWIAAVLDEKLPEGDFAEVLQNGVILCKLMNKIQPESVKKFKGSTIPNIKIDGFLNLLNPF